jgi:hypothetical protein
MSGRRRSATVGIALAATVWMPLGTYGVLASPSTPSARCRAWKVVPSPVVSNASLSAVSGTSPTDVWAVGSYFDGSGSIIEHWDGTSWTLALAQTGETLYGVAAISPTDVWGVGLFGQGELMGEHWDGSTWTIVPAPSPGLTHQLTGVSAVSSSDVWAVGLYTGAGGIHPLALHWDGTQWTKVPAPDGSPYGTNGFYSVSAISADDVWAVGYQDVTGGGDFQPLIEHWDGAAWSVVTAAPPPSGSDNQLYGVSGTSPTDVWAVGFFGTAKPLMEHWDGLSWSVVKPPPLTGGNESFGVTARSSSDVWAVGQSFKGGPSKPFAEHWDGTTWSVAASKNPGNSFLAAVATTFASDVWAVGDVWNEALGSFTPLIEHSRGPCARGA